jgi:UDP-N-acetylmuramyl pentapeptide phosphotransferase/UDP-N-acetylglucosamine-1-phosphate transferase
MDNILLSGALSFMITFFAIPVIIQVAREKKMFDEPDERKVHKMVIPTLGGLGIFAGFILATLLGVPPGNTELQYFVAAAVVIFFLGIKDDILVLSPAKKFIGQLIAASIVIRFGGIQITNMHGFLGIHEIPQMASVVFTLFTIIVITNSFNLIDGVDGLAGSLGMLTSLVFGLYFLYINQLMYAVMAFSLTGSLAGFLIYNFSPAKIFMGDTGSLLIGIFNAVMVIKFINIAGKSDAVLPVASAPAIGFAILLVPLFDTLRVFSLRILNRRSPFSADRTHIHHILLDYGFSHKMVTLILVSTNIAFIALTFFIRGLGTTNVISILLLLSAMLFAVVYLRRPIARNKQADLATASATLKEAVLKPAKILTLSPEVIEAE